MQKGVALVVCTYQRPDSIAKFLDSLSAQTRPVDQLVVVDASKNADTELVVARERGFNDLSYWRVKEPLRGLTRQRNFGLQEIRFDLVAFFDDDVVLEATCVEEMERAFRSSPGLVGLGCFAETWIQPTLLWRTRRALGVIPELRPGTYTRSGMSVPWRFHEPTTALVDGDWLPGCAMMLLTDVTRRVGFDEALSGYGQGEDLDFSLRLREHGRLAMAGSARCEHFHSPSGRPDPFKLGQMEICNRHRIWRRAYRQPLLSDRLRFGYAWTLDTVFLLRDTFRPRRANAGIRRIAGRVFGAMQVLTHRSSS